MNFGGYFKSEISHKDRKTVEYNQQYYHLKVTRSIQKTDGSWEIGRWTCRQSVNHLGDVGLCNVMARRAVRQERYVVGQRPRSAAVSTVRLLHTHVMEGHVFPERGVCVAYRPDVFKGEDTAVG